MAIIVKWEGKGVEKGVRAVKKGVRAVEKGVRAVEKVSRRVSELSRRVSELWAWANTGPVTKGAGKGCQSCLPRQIYIGAAIV